MRQPVLFLAVARSLLEAVLFASPAAALHGLTGGREPLPMLTTFALVFGASLILVALLRDARADRQNVMITVGVIGSAIGLSLMQPTREADGLSVLTRIIGFGLLGEAFVWRTLSVARSVTRWSDARTAAVLVALSLTVGALLPGIDTEPLPAFALVAVAAAALSLSLARSTEELDMAGRSAHGTASGRTAAGSALVLGALAILAALFAPSLRALVASGGDVLGPIASQILYVIALPFGYLAAFLVPLFQPLASLIFGGRAVVPNAAAQEQLMLEALEQTRPFVFGAVELLVALFAVAIGIILVDRLTRERRSALPDGATLERASASGMSLGNTLRGLLPGRARRRSRPRDDGSAAAAVRLLYWRFLELAENAGAGWRATAETPGEHQTRLRLTDARWTPAVAIVDAFERVRYGEEEPPADLVERARGALRELASRRD